MNVLLSIKPEFAEKILNRTKRYEFRKTTFRDPSAIDRVVMYASAPLQRIIGWFSFSRVVKADPESLWRRFHNHSGLSSRERFMDYFSGTDWGYALEIDHTVGLEQPVDPRRRLDNFRPPVSFQYLDGEFDFILDES